MIRDTTACCLFIAALIFMAFDVARLQIAGLFILGVALLLMWAWLVGVFTAAFWISDAATSARLDAIDQDLDERGL